MTHFANLMLGFNIETQTDTDLQTDRPAKVGTHGQTDIDSQT